MSKSLPQVLHQPLVRDLPTAFWRTSSDLDLVKKISHITNAAGPVGPSTRKRTVSFAELDDYSADDEGGASQGTRLNSCQCQHVHSQCLSQRTRRRNIRALRTQHRSLRPHPIDPSAATAALSPWISDLYLPMIHPVPVDTICVLVHVSSRSPVIVLLCV